MNATGLIIRGKKYLIPGLRIVNYEDNPKLKLRVGLHDGLGNNDGKERTVTPNKVILHTTKGIPGGDDRRPQVLHEGFGKNTDAEDRTAVYWSTSKDPSGAHLIVDQDGSIGQTADLATVCAHHAGDKEVNLYSIGIEIYQGPDAGLYADQLDLAVVPLVNFVTAHFGIQRQFPMGADDGGYPNRPIKRLDAGGKDVIGVFGHRDVSDQRGQGDPGDFVFASLWRAGYEASFNFDKKDDIATWKVRQQEISAKLDRHLTIDGIPGPATTAALRELGYKDGLWVLPPTPVPTPHAAHVEAILNGFYPTFLALNGNDEDLVLDAVEEWMVAKRHEAMAKEPK